MTGPCPGHTRFGMVHTRARSPDRSRLLRLVLTGSGLALGLMLAPAALASAVPSDEVALGVVLAWWVLACDPAGLRRYLPPARPGRLVGLSVAVFLGVAGLAVYAGYLGVAPATAPESAEGWGNPVAARQRVIVADMDNPLVTARVTRVYPDLALELEGGETVWLRGLSPYESDPALVRAAARELEAWLLGQVVTVEIASGVRADLAERAASGSGPRVECRLRGLPPPGLPTATPTDDVPVAYEP